LVLVVPSFPSHLVRSLASLVPRLVGLVPPSSLRLGESSHQRHYPHAASTVGLLWTVEMRIGAVVLCPQADIGKGLRHDRSSRYVPPILRCPATPLSGESRSISGGAGRAGRGDRPGHRRSGAGGAAAALPGHGAAPG